MTSHQCAKRIRLRQQRPSRGGALLFELIIAVALLGTAATVMMGILLSAAAQRGASEQRLFAVLQAENVLDELLAAPWGATTSEGLTERLEQLPATTNTRPQLNGLQRTVSITEEDEPFCRKVTIELRWKDRLGEWTAPVRLTGWKFPPPGVTP